MNDAFDADQLSEVTSSKKVGDKHVSRSRKLARPQAIYMPNENLGLPFTLLNGSSNAQFVAAVKVLEQGAIGGVKGDAARGVLQIGLHCAGTEGSCPIDDDSLDCHRLTEATGYRLVTSISDGLSEGEGFWSLRTGRRLADQNPGEQNGKKNWRSANRWHGSPATGESKVRW